MAGQGPRLETRPEQKKRRHSQTEALRNFRPKQTQPNQTEALRLDQTKQTLASLGNGWGLRLASALERLRSNSAPNPTPPPTKNSARLFIKPPATLRYAMPCFVACRFVPRFMAPTQVRLRFATGRPKQKRLSQGDTSPPRPANTYAFFYGRKKKKPSLKKSLFPYIQRQAKQKEKNCLPCLFIPGWLSPPPSFPPFPPNTPPKTPHPTPHTPLMYVFDWGGYLVGRIGGIMGNLAPPRSSSHTEKTKDKRQKTKD